MNNPIIKGMQGFFLGLFLLECHWGVNVMSSMWVGKKWGNPSFRERDILRHGYIDLKCWQRRYCVFPVILLNTVGQRHIHFRVTLWKFTDERLPLCSNHSFINVKWIYSMVKHLQPYNVFSKGKCATKSEVSVKLLVWFVLLY